MKIILVETDFLKFRKLAHECKEPFRVKEVESQYEVKCSVDFYNLIWL